MQGEGLSEELAEAGQGKPVRDLEVAGVRCQETEYLLRNQMERGWLFLSCFSLNLGKSLSLHYHVTENLAVVVTTV